MRLASRHGESRILLPMSSDPVLQQVQQAIQQFDEVPLDESTRRAYRIALARRDTDDAYRLALNLWDNKSVGEQQKLQTRLFGDARSESAEQRLRQCVREHTVERTPSRLRNTGAEARVVFGGSIADLQSMLDTGRQIYQDARSAGDWQAAANLFPGIQDRVEIIDRIRQWVFDYLVRTESYLVSSSVDRAERQDPTALQVANLHPWVATPALPLFQDEHWFAAVTAAADNVRARWKKSLGSEIDDLPSTFSPQDPKEGRPRMRFARYDRNEDEQAWINAHEGAMHFARGCIMRIRNLYKYQSRDQGISPSMALETLAALSLLSRWIGEAEVKRAEV